MSNSSFSSENAAPAALVSPCRTAGAADSTVCHEAAAIPTPPRGGQDEAQIEAEAGPEAQAHAEAGECAGVPFPLSTTPRPATTTSTSTPAAAATTSTSVTTPTPPTPLSSSSAAPTTPHADQIKYGRGPAVLHRPHGPSLLTQALATARGIPKSSQAQTQTQAQPPSQSQSQPSAQQLQPDQQPSSDSAAGSGQATPTPQDPQTRGHGDETSHAPHSQHQHQGDAGSLTPRASPRKPTMPSSTSVATTVAAPTYGLLNLGEVNSLLNGHRDFLAKAKEKGISLEKPDKRFPERPPRSSTFSHSVASGSGIISPLFTDSPTGLHDVSADESVAADSRPPPRTWKTEHRLSMGPEKAWSIGAEELANGQDGQVEKSITKVLAGVEPNARSRKASHSLGFFKQGLPEEKSKRKDSRSGHGQHPREKLLADKNAEETQPKGEAASASVLEEKPLTRTPRSWTAPAHAPDISPVRESPEDYFVPRRAKDASVKPQTPRPEAEEEQSLADETPDKAVRGEPRRGSDASAMDAGESAEDDEESSEEKIQSAVFLPHQAPDQEHERSSVPGVQPRATPSRTQSRSEDFHPWLVKADEPEPDHVEEDDDGEAQNRARDAAVSRVATELEPSLVDGPMAAGGHVESAMSPAKPSRPASQHTEDYVHDHQLAPKQPLDAIELIPYKHQVGGHTTLWRFSRRAVCKQLNNRENEFYENVEKYQRHLLAFLPRYIGVLNVTFQKQPRRKSTLRRDDAVTTSERLTEGESSANAKSHGTEAQKSGDTSSSSAMRPRVISQSIQSTPGPIPTVTFVDNQHILPRNLLQPTANIPSVVGRFRSASTSAQGSGDCEQDGPATEARETLRPSLSDRHANSWGATTVNKKLRNEVFNDAFLKQPIAIHRHRKRGQRPMPRRTLQQVLRPTGSDPSLAESREKRALADKVNEACPAVSSPLVQSHSDMGQGPHAFADPDDDNAPKDVTGTSAPEPEILGGTSPAQRKKRRYSGTGLRRKPNDVRDDRGSLKYFEEADDVGYKGDHEGSGTRAVPSEAPTQHPSPSRAAANGTEPYGQDATSMSALTSAATSGPASPTSEFKKIPRPINPKEAQTQRDSRVEYFLLLEDLTAGMKRPCIMDLKMGTRQYGVDANPKKQQSQQGKCAKTTSRELGVRVCGLQVWDVKTGSYVFKDKYYGRDLKKGREFQAALTRFLYDGADLSSILRHIPTVLQKLDELELIVERLDSYRFYAASLLMFYDGDNSTDEVAYIEDSTTDFATDTEEPGVSTGRRGKKSKREIDFKMADFANCVTPADDLSGKPCPPRHPGEPDRGFIRGLRSLRRYFLRIQRDTRAEMGLIGSIAGRNGRVRGKEGDGEESDLEFDEGYGEDEVSE